MNIIYKLLLFFSLYIFLFISSCKAQFKQKLEYSYIKNDSNIRFKEKNIGNKIFHKELLGSLRKEEEELHFSPLSIYIDTAEFNLTFPKDLEEYKDNYINAMNKAKNILEDLLEIKINKSATKEITKSKIYYINNYYGISNFTGIFSANFLKIDVYNYYIFGKFTSELNEESAPVILDDFSGTPFVGIVLFNDNMTNLDKSKLKLDYLTNLMLHHFIRLLGFNSKLREYGYIPYDFINDTFCLPEKKFPKVINYARKYFNCPSIDRINLFEDEENLDEFGFYYSYTYNDIIGLYWPKRLFLGELLTKYDYPEEQILSGFTLTFLDDLPYLRVINNYTGGLMKFGKHKGCKYLYNHCGDSTDSLSSTFDNEFYLPKDLPIEQEPSCSSGRLSKTIYKLEPIDEEEENDMKIEYVLNHKAGPKSTNYCPIAQYDHDSYSNRSIYNGRCSEINVTEINKERNEVLGENSFCVLSSLENKGNPKPKLIPLCYEMICSSKSLTIKIGEYYIVCPREGGKIKARNLDGFLLCPDYNLICTSSILCNNLLDCINKKSIELEGSFNYNYNIIKTTQNSNIYNNYNISYGYELTNEGICPYLCMQCKSKIDCTRCFPHYKFENKKCINAIEHCIKYENEDNDVCIECNNTYFLAESSNGRFCEINTNKDKYYLINDELKIYKKCEITNCQRCSSETQCILCNEGFNLVQNNDSLITCQNIDITKYYPINEGKIIYYKKCGNAITNCDECSSKDYCSKCKTNFGIVDNIHTKCENLLYEKYYYDIILQTFKLCSYKMLNCELCTTYGEFICKKCFVNYALKHENIIECSERTSLEGNKLFYSNDSGINYYSCLLFNKVTNCKECSNQNICNKCENGYIESNNKTLCTKKNDIINNETIPTNGSTLNFCSSLVEYCIKCNDNFTCNKCQTEAYLIDNGTCILKKIIEKNKNYYKDNSTNRYISCSIIPNCATCNSATVCISCQEGFFLRNNICNKIINNKISDDNDDISLSKGKIIGIVFGCFGFLLLIIGIIYLIIKKYLNNKKRNINITNIGENDKAEIIDDKISKEEKIEKAQENEEKIAQNLKQNNIVIHSVIRNIHNE